MLVACSGNEPVVKGYGSRSISRKQGVEDCEGEAWLCCAFCCVIYKEYGRRKA